MSTVLVLTKVTPGEGIEHVAAFTDLDKALDRRRTRMRHNFPWYQDAGGVWTTRSTNYSHAWYPYYRLEEVELR